MLQVLLQWLLFTCSKNPTNLTVFWSFSRITLEGLLNPFLFGSGSLEIQYKEELPMLYVLTYRTFDPIGYVDVANFRSLSVNITVTWIN